MTDPRSTDYPVRPTPTGDAGAPERQIVDSQVADLLGRSQAFRTLPEERRGEILRDTAEVVGFLARQDPGNPLTRALAGTQRGVQARQPVGYSSQGGRGGPNSQFEAAAMNQGVEAIRRLVNEVNFPDFVAELIRGTFQSIVDASIQQMEAYADLVKSVAMSLESFRDEQVTANQGRERLLQMYPNFFQTTQEGGAPGLDLREGADVFDLPDFQNDLGLTESFEDLDRETIESKLVPAARTKIALERQRLLATMVMMGINRIIVTDGEINAKVRFNFSAADRTTGTAVAMDYANMGVQIDEREISETEREEASKEYAQDDKGKRYLESVTGAKRYTTGAYQYAERPVIKLTSQSQTQTEGQLRASGQLTGAVRIKFRSETFPLERMVDTDQIQRIQGAGRGAPPRSASAPAAPAGTAPAAAPPANPES
jgi:hypothetical protein